MRVHCRPLERAHALRLSLLAHLLRLGLRYDHYSNAGIRKPNPGVELASIRYTHRF